jgi:hypothetical protein
MNVGKISAWAAMLLFAVAAFSIIGAAAANSDGIGKPIYTIQAPKNVRAGSEEPRSPVITVPTWSSKFSFSVGGHKKTFPYTMVGTNPWAGSATSTIPVQVVPIALIFSNGRTLDGASRLPSTLASPVFRPFQSQTGFTQFGDAVGRASFHSIVQSRSPNWHVLLDEPSVLSTQNITVPSESGLEFTGSNSGAPIGLVDLDWFGKQIESLMKAINPDPHTLTIFLTYNTFLFSGNPSHCCIVGYHSAIASPGPGNTQNIQTFVWATHNDPHIFAAPLQDITALSHEVAEWYSDPLVSNAVPAWVQPGSSACFSNILEVGDPLELFPDLSFRVTLDGRDYHPQDVSLFSWFARQSPSIGLNGRYSYRGGKLTTPAPVCERTPQSATKQSEY